MSFSWAPDAAAGGGYLGSGTGLTVQFHTYDDSWKETAFGIFGQLPGIYVALGGVGANQYYVLSSTNQPWLSVTPDTYIDGALDVHFSVSANGTFNMTYGGQVIFSNAVITGYAPITGGKMVFSASSGGLTENCWLDHVAISESPSTAPPSAPTGLTATPSLGRVTLGWSTSVGAIDYNVYRSTTSGGPYTLIASGLTSPDYADTGLNNGTTYYYVVKARSTYGGFSPYSTEVSATPTASAPPPAFVWAAEAVGTNGASSVSVTMTNNVGDALVVAVRMGNQGPAYFLPSSVSDTAGNTYILVSPSGNNGGSNDRGSAMYMASNIVASAANTITFTTNGIGYYWGPLNGLAIVVEEFANVASVETKRAVGTGYTATGTLSSGSLITTNVGDLLVFESDSQGGGSTWTAGSGYTIPANGQNLYQAMEYHVSSSPGTYSTSVNYDTASGSMDGVYVALIPKTAVIVLPPALVASIEAVATNGASSVSVTMANNAGDALVVAVRMGNQGPAYFLPSSVSDTAGNTYALVSPSGNNGGSNDRGSAMYMASNIVASAANTITFTTNGIGYYWGPLNGLAIVVEEFTNVAFLEADNNYGSGYSQKSSITSNPLTVTNTSDLLVFESDSQGGGSTWTAGSGYTIPANGQNIYLGMEYQVAGAPGTYSASVTYDVGTGSMDGVYAAFAARTEVVGPLPPPAPSPITFTHSGNQLSLSWSGGNGILLSSTNLALPVASWTPVVTNPPMPYIIIISPTSPPAFFITK